MTANGYTISSACTMREQNYLAATAEWMSLHVDLNERRVSPWPEHVMQRLAELAQQQGNGPVPEEAGSRMCVKEPVYALTEVNTGD